VQSGRDALGGITARVQQLAGEVDRSRGLLVELNQSLVEGLEQARVDGNALRTAVDEMRVTGLEVAKLMEGAEDKVEAAHAAMQAKIDQMLADLSEQADLAVLRAGDVGRRAEGEVVRRVDVAGSCGRNSSHRSARVIKSASS
jgi:ABC-type transporter Mla subunit MlaD